MEKIYYLEVMGGGADLVGTTLRVTRPETGFEIVFDVVESSEENGKTLYTMKKQAY